MANDPSVDTFLGWITVEDLGEDRFRGVCVPAWPGRAFGGQLAAQSLTAAAGTVPEGLVPWSIHTYFHAPVASGEDIDYAVIRVRDTRSLGLRQVRIEQQGSLRATSMVLFGRPGDGPAYEFDAPMATSPEALARQERMWDVTMVPPTLDTEALGYPSDSLLDLREAGTDPDVGFGRLLWSRVVPRIPDHPVITAATLCGLADLSLGTMALTPHGGRAANADLQLGALELALWFTAPASLSEWTLFAEDTAYTGRGHGLAYGAFYNSERKLCAIAMQNALMRLA